MVKKSQFCIRRQKRKINKKITKIKNRMSMKNIKKKQNFGFFKEYLGNIPKKYTIFGQHTLKNCIKFAKKSLNISI